MQNQLRAVSSSTIPFIDPEQLDNIKKWVTLFRRNWEIYVEMVWKIPLKEFQKDKLHMIGISDSYMDISTRGTSKTFLAAVAGMCAMLLYPNSRVVITSSTIGQANKLVEDKIRDELIKKLSPYLLYLYKKEYIIITKPDDGYTITCTLNGSTLRVLPALDSARGSRSNFTIFEEARLIKKNIIDSVFLPMSYPRQAVFLNNPKYAQNKRWIEEAKTMYITSARYQYEWFWNTFKEHVIGYYNDKHSIYNVGASDVFVSLENGLKSWSDIKRAKRRLSDEDFRMEILNEMIGESEEAFFNYRCFVENQQLKEAFRPYSPLQLILDKDKYKKEKEEDEVRLIVADFAFTETKGINESDYTRFICMSGHWKNDKFERHIDYLEPFPANKDEEAVQRLKELYYLYNGDYIVIDCRNGGENIMIEFTKAKPNEAWGSLWNTQGFTISDKMQYQVIAKDKLQYYRERTVDPNAFPCIIPFIGTPGLNTSYWRSTKRALESGNIKFLISMKDRQDYLEDSGIYFKMTPEELAEDLAPYGQTDLLIHEAVNLKTVIKNDNIKLEEPRNGHKDLIVTLAMGMLIFDLIEQEWIKQLAEDNYDMEDFQLVW